jgi:hypothetical protein
LFYLLAGASLAIQIGEQIAHEDGVELVLDCVDDFLGFFGVTGQLRHD